MKDYIWQHIPRDWEWRRDPPDVRATNPLLTPWRFRGRVAVPDPSSEDASFDASDPANDTNFSMDVDTTFRIRWGVAESNAKTNSYTPSLEYQIDGGGYAAVTTGTPIQWATGAPTGGASIDSNLLGSPGSGSFEATGVYTETGANSVSFTKSDFHEIEYCLTIDSAQVANDEVINLRPTGNFITTTGMSIPAITVVESTASNYTITGDVTVGVTVAATMDYTLNADITGAVTVTTTIAATMAYAQGLPIVLGFEDGTTNEFDNVTTADSNTVTATTTAAMAGTYGMECDFAGTGASAYGDYTLSAGEDELWVGFRLKLNSAYDHDTNGLSICLLELRDTGDVVRASWRIQDNSGTLQLVTERWNSYASGGSNITINADQEYWLEMRWLRGASSNGAIEWWVGNTKQNELTSITNDQAAQEIAIGSTGFSGGTFPTAASDIYIDDITFSTTRTGTTNDYTIAGDVTVAVTVAATMDYTLNASIAGAVTVTTDIAAAMAFASGDAIVGDVTVSVVPAAVMGFSHPPAPTGVLANNTDPSITDAADELYVAWTDQTGGGYPHAVLYRINGTGDPYSRVNVSAGTEEWVVTGLDAGTEYQITVIAYDGAEESERPATVTATTSGNAIVGDATVTVAVASGMEYASNRDITGDVTVTVDVASAMEYASNRSIAGDVTVTVDVASAMEYASNRDITGDVTVSVVPAATMEYTVGGTEYTITGDVTVAVDVASAMEYAANHLVTGDVTVSVVPAATLEYNLNADITGDVTVSVVPAATMAFTSGNAIVGDVTVSVVPAAALAYNLNASIAGDVDVDFAIAAALAYNTNPDITGDVAVTVDVASGMVYSIGGTDYTITGDVTVTTAIAAAMEYASNRLIVGDITVDLTPAAVLAYNSNPSIAGDVPISLTVGAGMVYNTFPELVGDVTVTLTPAAAMVKGLLAEATTGTRAINARHYDTINAERTRTVEAARG